MKKQKTIHPDGSVCVEGTKKVPRNYKPCCEAFEYRVSACHFDIRYEWFSKAKKWGIIVCDGGSSYIQIEYCPHCGFKLNS